MKKILWMIAVFTFLFGTATYASNFKDTKGLACEESVDFISNLGIVNGMGDGNFEPNKTLTRAEFSKMIVLTMKLDDASNVETSRFYDVCGHWAERYIAIAEKNHLLNGYTDGTFKPNGTITYAEAMTVMVRCLGYQNLTSDAGKPWYDCYMKKMEELNLNSNVKDLQLEENAMRGNVTILLKNMICCEERNNSSVSIFNEKFSSLVYWKEEKIISILGQDKQVWYKTSLGSFSIDENVDLGYLGSYVSGYYDKETHKLYSAEFTDKVPTKRLTGLSSDFGQMGYKVFEAKNIYGFGEKEKAEIVDLFVNANTNEIERVVYYDTSKSYFAEKVKAGADRVTIESKDYYENSIILLDNGQLLKFKILTTTCVMDINANATVFYNGKVSSWGEIPANSVIMEIREDELYECYQKEVTGLLDLVNANTKLIKVGNECYKVSDNCICENVVTRETAKYEESINYKALLAIKENDKSIKVYLNPFNEIAKVEFKHKIWSKAEENRKDTLSKKIKEQLENIGFVSAISVRTDSKTDKNIRSVRISSMPNVNGRVVNDKDYSVALGDFVRIGKDNKMSKIDAKLKLTSGDIEGKYFYDIEDNIMGRFKVEEDTEFVRVILENDYANKNAYKSCTLKSIEKDDLKPIKEYSNVYAVADEDGRLIRVYVIEVLGTSYEYGFIMDMEDIYSGDTYVITKVDVKNANGKIRKYRTVYDGTYGSDDMITFNVIANTQKTDTSSSKKKTEVIEDTIEINEVYKCENINSDKDLVVSSAGNSIVRFANSKFVLDISKDSFEYEGRTYYFDNYTFVRATVEYNKETNEYKFASLKIVNKKTMNLKSNVRFVIDELSNTIVCYNIVNK